MAFLLYLRLLWYQAKEQDLNKDHVPKIGDKIVYKDYTLEVIDVDGNKIDKVSITKTK